MNQIITGIMYLLGGTIITTCWMVVWAITTRFYGNFGFIGFPSLAIVTGLFISILK